MARIIQRETAKGEKRYLAQVRKKGQDTQSKTFKRKTDAKKWAQKIEFEIDTAQFTPEPLRHTFNELADAYRANVLPTKKPSTQYPQNIQLRYWREQFDDKKLSQITPALISQCRDSLKGEATHRSEARSGSTVNRYLALFL